MQRLVVRAFILLFLGAAAGCGSGHAGALPAGIGTGSVHRTVDAASDGYTNKLCGTKRAKHRNCFSYVLNAKGVAFAKSHGAATMLGRRSPHAGGGTIYGYYPSDLQSAYKLTPYVANNGGAGKIVAITDAYNDANAESDLAVYRSQFNLPACTTANGCFEKITQTGTTTFPPNPTDQQDAADVADWAGEVSLDLDMVSANCPSCKIVLVESTDDSNENLNAAVNEAASLSPFAISNSWGGPEYDGEIQEDEPTFTHAGIAITVASGDDGEGAEDPATFPNVISVGGTTLEPATNARNWTETAWPDSGSGCSAYIPKPAWQTDPGCKTRMTNDISYNADPNNSGVAVYDTIPDQYGDSGWLQFGGTSESAPAIAAILALTNTAAANASFAWGSSASLFDVTSGSNGSGTDCPFTYYCTAGVGYDGPTGNGTPNGAPGPAIGSATPTPVPTGVPTATPTPVLTPTPTPVPTATPTVKPTATPTPSPTPTPKPTATPTPTPTPSPAPTGPFIYVGGTGSVNAWPQQNFTIPAFKTIAVHPNVTGESIVGMATAADGNVDVLQDFPNTSVSPSYSDCRIWVGTAAARANQYECNPSAPAYGTSGVNGQRGFGAARGMNGELDVIEVVLGTYQTYDAVARITESSGAVTGTIPLNGKLKSHRGIAEAANGHIYVASTNMGTAQIDNFVPGVVGTGGVAPAPKHTFTINGRVEIGGLAISPDGNTLYAATQDSSGNNYLDSVAATDNGSASPLTSIAFGTAAITAVTVDANGTIYVAANGNVYAYLPSANGNATPLRTLTNPVGGNIGALAIGM